MVRMGREETMSPGIVMWAMDQVAERYAQRDGQTLQAAGMHNFMQRQIVCHVSTLIFVQSVCHVCNHC